MSTKWILLLSSLLILPACQLVSPIFVDYNGVRMDVASWINQKPFLSMSQKRTLTDLSKAQQRLKRFDEYDQATRLEVTLQNETALYCARQNLSEKTIKSLQEKVYGDELDFIQNRYAELAPKIKLDPNKIQCH